MPIARGFAELGYTLLATRGTARFLTGHGIKVQDVPKIAEGRPNLIDMLKNREVALVINTPSGRGARTDEGRIRAEARVLRTGRNFVVTECEIFDGKGALAAKALLTFGAAGGHSLQK